MFDQNILLNTATVGEAAHLERPKIYEGLFKEPAAKKFLPEPSSLGSSRRFTPLQAAMTCLYADLMRFGLTGPLAAKIAGMVKERIEKHPREEQFTLTVLESGAISVLPSAQVELATGWISGGYLSFALVIDARNYAARIARAVEAQPVLIGGGDEG